MLDSIITPFLISSNSILIFGTYDYSMVALSISIAILASFMGLQVALQPSTESTKKRAKVMLGLGSIALGGGIWSMHFIGMLAFNLCTPVDYGWSLTLLSLLPGIAASWVALSHINSHQKGIKPLLVGGLLVGSGIGTMHYTGMAAMEMAPLLRYNPWMFGLSIIVAVSLAILSLWIRIGLIHLWKEKSKEWLANLVSSIIMGLAIAGMHYTGMAAARFVKPIGFELSNQPAETSFYLALAVSATTVMIIFLVLGINLIYRYKDTSLRALKSERRLKATLDTAIDGIITINCKGKIVSTNQATEQLLGWAESELLGVNVKVLVPEPHASAHDGYLQRYLKTREARIIGKGREVQALHKNGELIDIQLSIGHVKIAQKDFFVAFISDIRQRLKMEAALQENERKLQSLVSNIPGIVFRCKNDKQWSMIFISDAVESITGYPADDFRLPNPIRDISELYHPDDYEKIYNTIVDQESYSLEYRIIRRDGEVRWLMEYGTCIKDDESGEVWLDGFIMDITDRYQMVIQLRLAKNRAEQAAQARASFLANMSHEIRTPMNAIIGFSDILLDSELEQDQQRHLKTINQAAKSLLHILNDVLDSAKLDKGKLELEVRPFSLIEEVDAIISTLWLQAKNKGLTLNTKVSPKLHDNYLGSPERIRQVLTNLINNAIKFTSEGFVTLTVNLLEGSKSDAHLVEFIIEDSGIGMSNAQLQTVFDPFTQADASMSRRFGGTGLGTSISKQLVELMDGEISAESEIDNGSKFRFVLPLTPSQNSAIESQKDIQLPPLTLLIVDDIQQNIDLLSILLTRSGHKVLTASDGQQALIKMQAEPNLDAVIMDVQMPIMDGLTAAKERRRIEHEENLSRMPIIALTASVLEGDKLAAEAAGMDGFANKPIDYQSLSNEIARILNLEFVSTNDIEVSHGRHKLIHEIKGISLWGSKKSYYYQLDLFCQQQAPYFKELSTLAEQKKWIPLKDSVHKLKGLCANLSLMSLMNQLEILESELHDCEQVISNIQNLFNQVQEQVSSERLTSAESVFDSQSLNQSNLMDQSTEDLSDLILLLQKLKNEASQNEVNEEPLLQLLDKSNICYTVELNQIYQALNDFEFEQAEQSIEALLVSLNSK